MPPADPAAPAAAAPPRAGWALTLLNWVLPGFGFIMVGRRARGFTQLAIVLTTFGLGLALRGGVIWPVWSLSGEHELNIINNVMFLIQAGSGAPALLSLFGQLAGLPLLAGLPEHPFYELGAYFIVVAGALNYYAACNFYDRLVSPAPRYRDQEKIGHAS